MLKSIKPYLLVVILSLVFTTVSVNNALSQPPPPPPGGGTGTGHNLNVNQGAPLGEGIWILLTMAISYGLHTYMRRKENVGDESLQEKLVTAETNNHGWETHDSGLKAFINHTLRPFLTRIFHYHKS